MSEEQNTFLKQLKITLLAICGPTVLIIIWSLISMYFGQKDLKATVKANTEAVAEFRKYYMTTQDFWDYSDLQKAGNDAKRNGDLQRLQGIEKDIDEIKDEFQRKTRGLNNTIK